MSKSIDQRIVEMQFNNRQFESGIQDSLGSLDKLKKGLVLDNAGKGLNDLSEVGRKFSLSGIADGVHAVTERFTTLGIIGVTALQNITNSAINAGKRIVSALTIDPITTGFNEYELKMGSIQTIMAGSGASLEEVNAKLNELNTYSDKTIYSFSDMTSNIGKFTNAGVSLNDSVLAIKGVANVAAVSGANANEASRAMYNFAQALSSGYVKLIDWKSIELANMGTVEFKQQLIDAAVAAGTLAKTGDDMYQTYSGSLVSATQGFNDSLQDQWMTTEVLVRTLNDYADETTEIGKKAFAAAQDIKSLTQMYDTLKEGAQSGWAQSWEIISGDFEEAKKLYTDLGAAIGDMIQQSADSRNEMLQLWKDSGGREALINSFKNSFEALNSVLIPIKEAFSSIFPSMSGEKLASLTKALEAFTEKLKIGGETSDNIRRTFAGLFAVLDIGKQAVSAVAKGLGKLITALSPGASNFLDFSAGIGDWLVSLDEAVKKSDIFNKAIEKVADIIEEVANKVKTGITAIGDFFKQFGSIDLSGAEAFADRVKIRFEPFSALFEGISKIFSKGVEIFKKVAPLFYKLATMIGDGLSNLMDRISEAVQGGQFNSLLDIVNTGLLGTLMIGIKKFISSMSEVTDGFSGILDGVKGSLEAWQSSLKAGVLLKIATAIGILAAALLVLAMIDSEKLTSSLAAITTLFVDLFGSMAIFSKLVDGPGFKSIQKVSTAMIGISAAVLILAFAMSKLAALNWDEITRGLVSVGALMTMLVASVKVLSQNEKSMMKGALGLILFAAAINVLASAVKKLGEIDPVSLTAGLIAVGVLMTELALFMKATDLNSMGASKAAGILLLSAAMAVLSTAVKKLSEIDTGALIQGLIALGVLLTEIALFIKATPDATKVMSTALGLVVLGAAMVIFGSAIEKMGSLPLEQIGKGLLAMAGSLAIIVVAMKAMPKNMLVSAAALIVVAGALLLLSVSLKSMGGMEWEEIAKGLVTLAGSLGIIALAMTFMTTALPGAAALLIVAGALAVLAPVLLILGTMSWGEIGKGLLAMAGVFGVFGAAGLLLGPLTPVLIGLSAAIAIFGAGCLAIGAGLLAFSAGLAALAVAGTAGSAALVAIVTAIIGLIPYLLEQIGVAIIAFAGVITEGMPAIMEAIGALFKGIIDLLGELTPPLVLTVLEFIMNLLNKLVEYVPQFVDAGMQLIVGFLKGIADNMEALVATAISIVLNFINGIVSKIPDIINTAFQIIISFINGLADAIRNNHEALYDACANLIDAMIDAITSLGCKLVDIGKNLISGLIDGVKSMAKKLWDAAVSVVKNAVKGAKSALGIHSPSKVFAEIGMYSMEGLAGGMQKFSGLAADAAVDAGDKAKDSLSNAISNLSNDIDGDLDMDPTIRPVIDLSEIEAGERSINGMFGDQQMGLDVSSTNGKINTLASDIHKNDLNAMGLSAEKEEVSEVVHSGTISIKGVNSMDELIGAVEIVIEDSLPKILRREVRMA